MKSFELPYGIEISRIFNEKWLNATASMTAVKKEIGEKISEIADELEMLESLEAHADEALAYYRDTLDFRATLKEVQRLEDFEAQKKRIEEERQKKENQIKAEKSAGKENPNPAELLEQRKEKQAEGQWVAFQAFLTNETALKLKQFFVENKIEFKPVKA